MQKTSQNVDFYEAKFNLKTCMFKFTSFCVSYSQDGALESFRTKINFIKYVFTPKTNTFGNKAQNHICEIGSILYECGFS